MGHITTMLGFFQKTFAIYSRIDVVVRQLLLTCPIKVRLGPHNSDHTREVTSTALHLLSFRRATLPTRHFWAGEEIPNFGSYHAAALICVVIAHGHAPRSIVWQEKKTRTLGPYFGLPDSYRNMLLPSELYSELFRKCKRLQSREKPPKGVVYRMCSTAAPAAPLPPPRPSQQLLAAIMLRSGDRDPC